MPITGNFSISHWKPSKECNYLKWKTCVHDESAECNLFNEYFASISNAIA